MTGIKKVTPSRSIRPVKSGNKNKPGKKSNKRVEKQVSKDTTDDTDSPIKHIDERI